MSPTILKEPARKELRGVYQRRRAARPNRRPRADAITRLSPHHIWVHTRPSPGQWGITESGMRVRYLSLTHPAHSPALPGPPAKATGGRQVCVDKAARPVLADKNDPDYRRALKALTEGVVHRDQPGAKDLLKQRKPTAKASAAQNGHRNPCSY